MCLGIPGKITEISDPTRKLAMVDISVSRKTISNGIHLDGCLS